MTHVVPARFLRLVKNRDDGQAPARRLVGWFGRKRLDGLTEQQLRDVGVRDGRMTVDMMTRHAGIGSFIEPPRFL